MANPIFIGLTETGLPTFKAKPMIVDGNSQTGSPRRADKILNSSRKRRPTPRSEIERTERVQPLVPTTVPALEPVFSVAEIAETFRCSTEKVKRTLRRRDPGGLHGFKFGRAWFVPLRELERYIENGLDSAGHLRREEEL